ncbi:MAG: acetate--CoA ligase family protein [Desulfobacterales bacterium]|nr:MAG: acetate--CoA ligase family protein [Desulfobacterales bacterium]
MKSVQSIIETALAAGQRTLSEYDSKLILADYGIPTTQESLVGDLVGAEAAAKWIGYPVVLKVCAGEAVHKTEQELIELGIMDAAELKRAFERLSPKAHEFGGQVLVQEMVKGSRELVIGLTRDIQLGPCVMFGLGGIFTEALADVSFRMAPLNDNDVREMCGEIQGSKILEGIRGLKPVNLDILSHCLKSLGRIGLDYPAIREIDINPLIVRDDRPLAVDALIVLEKPQHRQTETAKSRGGLDKFFEPGSVAIIGASSTPHKAGNDVIQNILANEYDGNLYLVNPKGGEILGHKVYASINELPDEIDLAIIILPAAVTPQAIRDCAARGVKAVVLSAGGFAEVDERGESLQQETLRAIRDTGIRAIGPNTSGHTSSPHKFTSTFFPLGKIPRGNVSYIAQTGNFATHTMRYIKTGENFGVARVLGMGNKLDVEESEVLEYYAQDPETKAIFIYLESFKRPRRFLEVACKVTRSKPVILLKGGATAAGADAAVAHTAALASDDRIIDGVLKQAGVVRVYNYSHLFLAAKAISAMPLPKGNRVSFLAPSGAMLVCLTDLCRKQWGLSVPDVEEKTRRYLQDISPPFIRMRNPVDIWPAATVKGVEFGYRKGTEAVLRDHNIDAVVMILMITDETGVPPLDFIVELARRYPQKPLYVTFTGQKKHMDAAKAFLEPQGVPTFPLIEEPFEVLSILARCRQAMER